MRSEFLVYLEYLLTKKFNITNNNNNIMYSVKTNAFMKNIFFIAVNIHLRS